MASVTAEPEVTGAASGHGMTDAIKFLESVPRSHDPWSEIAGGRLQSIEERLPDSPKICRRECIEELGE
jgi:hypothetical protein